MRVGNFGKQPKGKGKGKDSDSSANPSPKDRDSSRNNQKDKKCDYCKFEGHIKDKCYFLYKYLYPKDWKPRNTKLLLIEE